MLVLVATVIRPSSGHDMSAIMVVIPLGAPWLKFRGSM